MNDTGTLPEFPTRASVDRKVAAYGANALAHERGEHPVYVALCKACGERRRSRR